MTKKVSTKTCSNRFKVLENDCDEVSITIEKIPMTIDNISDIIKQKYPTMPLHKFNHLLNKIKLMNFNDLLVEAEEIIYPSCHASFWNF